MKGRVEKIIIFLKNNWLKLSLICAGILAIGVGACFGYLWFVDYRDAQIGEQKNIQAVAEEQKKSLEEAKLEIGKLKAESAESKKAQKDLEQKINPEGFNISATEIDPYLTGVVKISCKDGYGSGSMWNLKEVGYAVVTNKHVVELPYDYGGCTVDVDFGVYQIYPSDAWAWNDETDISVLKMKMLKVPMCDENGLNCKSSEEAFTAEKNLNYKLNSLRKCPTKMPIGSPVIIIGYPSFGEQVVDYGGIMGTQSNRMVTNGIVSGYDEIISNKYIGTMPYNNYFVSAKIDSGNSGGITLAKDKNGLCVLGIPTWLSLGEYETQGIVQNIHNVMYQK